MNVIVLLVPLRVCMKEHKAQILTGTQFVFRKRNQYVCCHRRNWVGGLFQPSNACHLFYNSGLFDYKKQL